MREVNLKYSNKSNDRIIDFYFKKDDNFVIMSYINGDVRCYEIMTKGAASALVKGALDRVNKGDSSIENYNTNIDAYVALGGTEKYDKIKITKDLYVSSTNENDFNTIKAWLKKTFSNGNFDNVKSDNDGWVKFEIDQKLLEDDYLVTNGFTKHEILDYILDGSNVPKLSDFIVYSKDECVIINDTINGSFVVLTKENMRDRLAHVLNNIDKKSLVEPSEQKRYNETIKTFEEYGGKKGTYDKFIYYRPVKILDNKDDVIRYAVYSWVKQKFSAKDIEVSYGEDNKVDILQINRDLLESKFLTTKDGYTEHAAVLYSSTDGRLHNFSCYIKNKDGIVIMENKEPNGMCYFTNRRGATNLLQNTLSIIDRSGETVKYKYEKEYNANIDACGALGEDISNYKIDINNCPCNLKRSVGVEILTNGFKNTNTENDIKRNLVAVLGKENVSISNGNINVEGDSLNEQALINRGFKKVETLGTSGSHRNYYINKDGFAIVEIIKENVTEYRVASKAFALSNLSSTLNGLVAEMTSNNVKNTEDAENYLRDNVTRYNNTIELYKLLGGEEKFDLIEKKK